MDLNLYIRQRVDLAQFLEHAGEVSHLATINAELPRSVVLGAASNYETRIVREISEFFVDAAYPAKKSFVLEQALNRKFHALFDWDASNANKFAALFGRPCKDLLVSAVGRNGDMDQSVKAFLAIGKARNLLVHNDFISSTVSYTYQETVELVGKAELFVQRVPLLIRVDEQFGA